jgi:hypothetical protein
MGCDFGLVTSKVQMEKAGEIVHSSGSPPDEAICIALSSYMN